MIEYVTDVLYIKGEKTLLLIVYLDPHVRWSKSLMIYQQSVNRKKGMKGSTFLDVDLNPMRCKSHLWGLKVFRMSVAKGKTVLP